MVFNGAARSLPAPIPPSEEAVKRTPVLLLLVLLLPLLIAGPLGAAGDRVTIPLENSPSLGPENAPVTIVEFIDFQ